MKGQWTAEPMHLFADLGGEYSTNDEDHRWIVRECAEQWERDRAQLEAKDGEIEEFASLYADETVRADAAEARAQKIDEYLITMTATGLQEFHAKITDLEARLFDQGRDHDASTCTLGPLCPWCRIAALEAENAGLEAQAPQTENEVLKLREDRERLDWIEGAMTLHQFVQLTYLVDCYELEIQYTDGRNDESFLGSHIRTAIDAARKAD